jgi:hypothetical protein
MAVNELIFDGKPFWIAGKALQVTCEIFAPNSPPTGSRPPASQSGAFPTFCRSNQRGRTRYHTRQRGDLDALCKEFRFTEFGDVIAAFLRQHGPGHSEADIAELRAAIAEQRLQHERDMCRLER